MYLFTFHLKITQNFCQSKVCQSFFIRMETTINRKVIFQRARSITSPCDLDKWTLAIEQVLLEATKSFWQTTAPDFRLRKDSLFFDCQYVSFILGLPELVIIQLSDN